MTKVTFNYKTGLVAKTSHVNQIWDDDINELKNVTNNHDDRIVNLEDNQVTGVITYSLLADLPVTGVVNTSYKVTNDPTPANNGYYTWNGSIYVKEIDRNTGLVEEGNTEVVSGDTVFQSVSQKVNADEFLYSTYTGTGSYSQIDTEVILNADGHFFECYVKVTNLANEGAYNIGKRTSQSHVLGFWTNGSLYIANGSGFISLNAFGSPVLEGELVKVSIKYESGDLNVYKNDVLTNTFAQSEIRFNRIADAKCESPINRVLINDGTLKEIGVPYFSDLTTEVSASYTQLHNTFASAIEDNNYNIVNSDTVKKFGDTKINATFDAEPTESSTNQVNSGNQWQYLQDTYTSRDLFVDGVEQSLGTIDNEKGEFIYAQKGLGIKTYLSPTSGTYNFNALDIFLGTIKQKSDLILRVYTGNFSGTSAKNPNNFTRLSKVVGGNTVYAEKIIKNVPVNDTKQFTVVFDEIFEFTSAGSIDFLAVFVVAVDDNGDGTYTQNGKTVLMPYHDTQNVENTRAGMYYQLGTEVDYFNDDYNYASTFYTAALNFKIVQEVEQVQEYKPFIMIASNVYAVVGTQINIQYDALINCIDGGANGMKDHDVFISGSKGRSLDRFWQYTPTGGDVGTTTMIVHVRQNGKIVNTKSFTLNTIAATAPVSVKEFIQIGDSNTDFTQQFAAKTQTVKDKFTALGGSEPVFRGSKDDGFGLKNEGSGGYSFESYATDWISGNPFWNAGAIDIANYKTANSITNMDVVTISLLTNDANSFFGGGFAEYTVDKENEIVQYAKDLIDAIIAGNTGSKIIINLPPIGANTLNTNKYGTSNKDNSNFKNALFLLAERFLSEFDNGAYNANVEMGNAGICVDRYYGYGMTSTQIATRITDTVDYHNNYFHPKEAGYQQLGDAEFAHVLNAINN